MAPAPERHRKGDRRKLGHHEAPAGTGHHDPSSDARQPRCPPPGQEPEHGGVEVIVEPQRRRSHRGDDHDSQDDNHERQPCPGTHRHRARQWRRRAGRAAPGRRSPHGGAQRKTGQNARRGHRPCLVAHRTAPPVGASPCARSQLPATSRGASPRSSTWASRARSDGVERRADTAFSTATNRGP